MTRRHGLALAAVSFFALACNPERPATAPAAFEAVRGGRPAPNPMMQTAAVLRNYLDRFDGAYDWSHMDAERRATLLARKAALSEQFASLQSMIELSRRRGMAGESNLEDGAVDAAGEFVAAGTNTDPSLRFAEIWVQSQVNVVAVLSWNLTGSISVTGQQQALPVIGSGTSIIPLLWDYKTSPMNPAINCEAAAHSVSIVTAHVAGFHVRGWGLNYGHTQTYGSDECAPSTFVVTVGLGSAIISKGRTTTATTNCPFSNFYSTNPFVATVTSSGVVTSHNNGTTVIASQCLGSSGTATLTVTLAEDCNVVDTYATLRMAPAAALTSPGFTAITRSAANSTESPCGQTTTPGSGGGEPPSSPEPDYSRHCFWSRYYVIYTDGSWEFIGEWFYSCEYASLRMSTPPPSSPKGPPTRVQMIGKGRLSSGRAVQLLRDPTDGTDVFVAVDTTRATAADVELALLAAEEMSAKPMPTGRNKGLGQIFGADPAIARASLNPQSRAASVLRDLLRADGKATDAFGLARVLEFSVDRDGNKDKWREIGSRNP